MSKQEKNNRLLLLYDMGVRDFNELQIMTDIHLRTLYRSLAKLRQGQTFERMPGGGRPKTFRGDNKRSLTLLARNNPEFSAKDLKQAVASKGGPSASIRTIQRSLRDSGFTKKRAKQDPDLTVSQMEKRLGFTARRGKAPYVEKDTRILPGKFYTENAVACK